MTVEALKLLLDKYPDEAEVYVLNDRGTGITQLTDVRLGESDKSGNNYIAAENYTLYPKTEWSYDHFILIR